MSENSLYYNQDGIVVRRSEFTDVAKLEHRLRISDQKEIWASHHLTSREALEKCVHMAIFSLTIENGQPMGIFGINPFAVTGQKAIIWMLATDDLDKIKHRFLKHSKEFVNMMLAWYPYLENWVHAKNVKSIKWLKYLGATIEEAQPYGLDGELFHHFYFTKG